MKNKNPIINELKNLNLIKLSKLIKISNSTRDFKNLKVYRDSINKIIFLEKYVSYLNKHNNYESEKPKNKKLNF